MSIPSLSTIIPQKDLWAERAVMPIHQIIEADGVKL
jgi:hypothetical protein